MPVWGLWQEDGFYFGTDPASRKGRNLAANPNAALHLESGDEVVIVQGVVRQAQGAARLAALADAYQAKYQVRPEEGFYWLRPRTALAWTEKDFPNNATRWRFP
jgi:pyridoxine/pyridoxamine 5'-phosphate oxidase